MTHGATKSLQQLMTKHQCGEHHAAVSPQLLGLPLTRSLETNHGAWWSDLVRRHELPAPCVRLRPCLDKDGRGLRGRQNHPLKHTGCRKAKKATTAGKRARLSNSLSFLMTMMVRPPLDVLTLQFGCQFFPVWPVHVADERQLQCGDASVDLRSHARVTHVAP